MENVIGKIDIPHERELEGLMDPEIEKMWQEQYEKVVSALIEAVTEDVGLGTSDKVAGLYADGVPRFVNYEYAEYDGPEVFFVEGSHPEIEHVWPWCDRVVININAENPRTANYVEDAIIFEPRMINGVCAFELRVN